MGMPGLASKAAAPLTVTTCWKRAAGSNPMERFAPIRAGWRRVSLKLTATGVRGEKGRRRTRRGNATNGGAQWRRGANDARTSPAGGRRTKASQDLRLATDDAPVRACEAVASAGVSLPRAGADGSRGSRRPWAHPSPPPGRRLHRGVDALLVLVHRPRPIEIAPYRVVLHLPEDVFLVVEDA